MEQIKLSDENFNRLLQYKDIFDNVKKNKTLRGAVRKNTMEISEIIGHKTNYNCSACVFRLYQQAAEILDYNIELRKNEQTKRRTNKKKQTQKVESEIRSTDID